MTSLWRIFFFFFGGGDSPHKGAVTQSLNVFFVLPVSKSLNKHWSRDAHVMSLWCSCTTAHCRGNYYIETTSYQVLCFMRYTRNNMAISYITLTWDKVFFLYYLLSGFTQGNFISIRYSRCGLITIDIPVNRIASGQFPTIFSQYWQWCYHGKCMRKYSRLRIQDHFTTVTILWQVELNMFIRKSQDYVLRVCMFESW